MTKLPLKVRIIQAFIKHKETRLTASEIAKYCNTSQQAISYQLKRMTQTSLIIPENSESLKKTYYCINDFFLNLDYLNQARESLYPFIQFFIEYFYFPDEMSDQAIEQDIIEFIHVITWLFAKSARDDLEIIQNDFE